MKVINPKINIETFFTGLRESQHRALLLDYDGTLAPFQKERNKAFPYPGVREILGRIILENSTKVVIISGRPVNDLIPLLELKDLPEIWGSHGGERILPDGTHSIEPLSDSVAQMLISFSGWMEEMGWDDLLEKKPLGLAVHWRGLDSTKIGEIRKSVMAQIPMDVEKAGLSVRPFDGGLELRPFGIDKGEAVRRIIRDMGQNVVAAYLGDDLTDEDAFEVIKDHGIAILVRDEFRDTTADVWLRPPDELLGFLRRWAST